MSNLPDAMSNGPNRSEHMGNDAHIWERPWTLDEMRKNSENWSLAADSGLFLFLQDFSQRMLSKTHDIEKQLDNLIRDTKATDSCLQSVFNDFLMLSNTQFIENRVYDEEVEEAIPKNDVVDNKPEQKTREQKEAELIPKMQEAVTYGLKVLDSAFEHLDIKAGNSDSEDEDGTDRVEAILEPKDLYVDRPLPFLIGSQAFMDQDDVGLGDLSSDEMSVDSDRDSVIESEEGKDSVHSDDLSAEDDDLHNNIKKKSLIVSSGEDDDDDGEDSDIFGESDQDDEEDTKNTNSSSFAEELAARIKGEPVKKQDGDRASLTSKKKSKVRKESKPSKQEAEDDDDSDDMFKPPKMDDEDFSPFGGTSGLFSGGRGLFDDDDDEEKGDLFSEAPKPAAQKEKKISNDSIRNTAQTSESAKPVKKNPPGAGSIFSDNGLFGSENDSDSLEDNNDRSPSTKSLSSTSKKTSSLPSTGGGGGIAGGLFDEEEDDNEIFSGQSTKRATTERQRKTVDLFAENDDDRDIFSDSKVSFPPHDKKEAVKEQIKPLEKKMPAGAVSIFGPETKSLISEGLKRRQASASEESEKSQENGFATDVGKTGKPKTSGLFSDDDDTQIFPTIAKSHSKSESSSQRKGSKAPLSFFDDQEEDLFVSAAKAKPNPQDKVSTTQSSNTDSLFSDDEGQWLSSNSIASKPEAKTGGMTSSVSAPSSLPSVKSYPKNSLFDDYDDDLFTSTKESSQSNPHRVALLFEDEDNEDQGSLFGIEPAASAPAVPAKVPGLSDLFNSEEVQASTPAAKEKLQAEGHVPTKKLGSPDEAQDTSQTKKKPVGAVSLFGGINVLANKNTKSVLDEDDDDGFLSKEAPPADVKKEEKGKTNTLSLFDNEEEDKSDWNDSIFKSNKPASRDTVKHAEERATVTSTGVFQDEELLFSHTQQKDNDPDVDLFATSGKASNFKHSTVKQAAPSLFSDDDEDDLFISVKSTPPPVIAKKPITPSANRESASEKTNAAPSQSKPKEPSSRIGKLQANLKLDPTLLLPGSSPSMPGLHSVDTTSSSGVSSSSLSPSPATPVEARAEREGGVNFDPPLHIATLQSAHKSRAKGSAMRRPQSRAARQHAAQRSIDGNEEFTTQSLNDSKPAFSGSFQQDLMKQSVSSKPEFPTTSSKPPVDESSSRPSVLTLPVSTHAVKQDSSKTSANVLAAAAAADDDDDDDLFGTVSATSSTVRTAQHQASREAASKKEKEKPALPSIFDGNIDDIFQKMKPKSAVKETKASSFVKEDDDGDDDLFGLSNSATPLATSSKEVKSSSSFLKQNLFKDDVATVPKVQKKSKEKPVDSSLFDDNIDIFADLSEVTKPKPMSKTKAETKSIFDDDMDDIFSTSTKTVAAKAPSKSKKTSPPEETSTTKSSNIFDDPLNALGGK